MVGQSRRTIGSCSQTQAATVATDHHPCGTFDAYKIYARLDIIEHDGGSYIAVRDDPGTIPGEDGWQLLSAYQRLRIGRRTAIQPPGLRRTEHF